MVAEHSKTWWQVKVAVGAILILLLVEKTVVGFLPMLWQMPVWPGQFLATIGGVCTIWHYRLLGQSSGSVDQPQVLVTRGGLYARIRHPMYLGDCLLYLGLFLLAPSLPGILLLCGGWYSLSRQADEEETAMKQSFPREFEAWLGVSGRLLPRLTSRAP